MNGTRQSEFGFQHPSSISRSVFGPTYETFSAMSNAAIERSRHYEYCHLDNEVFVEKSKKDVKIGNEIYWRELVERAHFVSVHSLIRTARWSNAVVDGARSHSLFAFSAALRSLIEAGGDSLDALLDIPLALAERRHDISLALSGKAEQIVIIEELEEKLIHYTHGRKLQKKENAPKYHKAKPSYDYIKTWAGVNSDRTADLYGKLCQIVHPAHLSVDPHTCSTKDGAVTSVRIVMHEQMHLNALLNEYKNEISGLLMQLNAPLLTLRVLHLFGFLPKIPELRKVDFSSINGWSLIEKAMRS